MNELRENSMSRRGGEIATATLRPDAGTRIDLDGTLVEGERPGARSPWANTTGPPPTRTSTSGVQTLVHQLLIVHQLLMSSASAAANARNACEVYKRVMMDGLILPIPNHPNHDSQDKMASLDDRYENYDSYAKAVQLVELFLGDANSENHPLDLQTLDIFDSTTFDTASALPALKIRSDKIFQALCVNASISPSLFFETPLDKPPNSGELLGVRWAAAMNAHSGVSIQKLMRFIALLIDLKMEQFSDNPCVRLYTLNMAKAAESARLIKETTDASAAEADAKIEEAKAYAARGAHARAEAARITGMAGGGGGGGGSGGGSGGGRATVNAVSTNMRDVTRVIDKVPAFHSEGSQERREEAIAAVVLYIKTSLDSWEAGLSALATAVDKTPNCHGLYTSVLRCKAQNMELLSEADQAELVAKALLLIRGSLLRMDPIVLADHDATWFSRFRILTEYGENKLGCVERVDMQEEVLRRCYPTQFTTLYPNIKNLKRQGLLMAMRKSSDPVDTNWCDRATDNNWDWAQLLEHLQNSDPGVRSARHKSEAKSEANALPEQAQPVYQADSAAEDNSAQINQTQARGQISSEVIAGVKDSQISMEARLMEAIAAQANAMSKQVGELAEKQMHLEKEHMVLRTVIDNHKSAPAGTYAVDSSHSTTARTRNTAPPETRPTLGILALGAATRSGAYSAAGGKASSPKDRAAAVKARDDIDISTIPKEWQEFTRALLDKKNRKITDEDCVICDRNGLQSGFPHPTSKCGFLWTLSPPGLKWLRERNKDRGAAGSRSVNLLDVYGHTDAELTAEVCHVCEETDVSQALKVCDAMANADDKLMGEISALWN